MAFRLTKRVYGVANTKITSQNMNDIQDGVIDLEDNAVRADAQSLTAAQKTQARTNIGVGNVGTLSYTDLGPI